MKRDPIFAVIERHRQKSAQRDKLHDEGEGNWQRLHDSLQRRVAEKKAARADLRVIDEEHRLATTMPTTLAGLAALAEYIAKQEASGSELAVRRVRGFRGQTPPEWSCVFHRTLARALSKIAA
jgi:hypothetical protein